MCVTMRVLCVCGAYDDVKQRRMLLPQINLQCTGYIRFTTVYRKADTLFLMCGSDGASSVRLRYFVGIPEFK